MSLQKAGINLTLQGEAQYIAGLRNVNREMNLMATNTKLAVAQLGYGASPTQKFNAQMKHLSAGMEIAATKTMVLRNRNKELPNAIYETGKSLDKLKDKYKEQGIVQESLTETQVKMRKQYGYQSEQWEAADKALKEHTKTYKETEQEVKKLEAAYNGMLTDFETMPNQMAEAQLAAEKLLFQQQKLREEYLKGGGVFTGFADKLESTGEKLQKYGRNISDIGNAFMGVTFAILGGGAGALKAYSDWEAALRGAMKTNDEVVDSTGKVVYSYDDLEQGLRGLSKEIPVTNTELAELAEIAGRLQVPTDEVVAFTEVVAKLGETTNLTSQEAAEQLGKFINITGAGSESTLNLANALVALGNSTAASEQETLRMSTRWASTGKIIGMTDDQILALSASVISLGIRTEAGGSAVQRSFLKINDAVLEGKDKLADFSKVAGMSSKEFKKAWQDDAATALIPFLKGLNDTHEAGGNVNSILRDLGVTSVNELNTLLVLAGGYDQLAGNLDTASVAYHETEEAMMELNKEAELAYGTTLGKLRTAWNRLKDSLIDIGEPIADAVTDIVEGSEPLFEWIEKVARGFSDMDQSAQRDIISMVAKIALIAPALKVVGGSMTTLGDIFTVSSKVVRKTGEIITGTMMDLGAGAFGASGSNGVGGLVSVLGGSGVGALPWALGIAAVALGGFGLWKAFGEDAFEAAKRTKEWGFAISEETANATNDFLELSEKASNATKEMSVNVESGATKAANAYETMATEILNSVNGNIAEAQEVLGMFSDEMVDIVGGSYEKYIEKQENLRIRTEDIQSKITAIYENATRENRELTDEEISIIEGYHTRLAELRSKSLDLSADEQRKVMAIMKNDLEQFSDEQLKARERYLRDEQKLARESNRIQKESLDEQLATGQLTKEKHQKAMKQLDEEAKADAILVASEMLKVWEAQGVGAQEIKNRLAIMASETGFTYEEVAKKARESAMVVTDSTGIMAKELDNMTEDTKKANEAWNTMVLDEKTGEVHTNIEDILKEIATADNGWEELDFILKNANLDTNAKQVLFTALSSNKEWWEMKFPIKNADLLTNAGGIAKQFLIAYDQWEGLDPKVHRAILDTNTPEQLRQILKDHGVWEKLNPREWDLLFQNNSTKTSRDIKAIHNEWKGTEFERKNINVTTNAWSTADSAKRAINSVKGRSVTVQTTYKSVYATAAERGLNFHTGGTALVNDQSGAMFRELITLPDGQQFIPEGRNVLLDLPRGSKVLKAGLTKKKFPSIKQYKDGVGYSGRELHEINSGSGGSDMSQTNNLLSRISNMLREGQTVVVNIDGYEAAKALRAPLNREFGNATALGIRGR